MMKLLFSVNCAGVVNGDIGFCSCFPCGINEGPCFNDNECMANLFCGYNNCPASFGFSEKVDCCTKYQFKSQNYPSKYSHNTEQSWHITASVGSYINLQFHTFHVILQFF